MCEANEPIDKIKKTIPRVNFSKANEIVTVNINNLKTIIAIKLNVLTE